MNMLEHVRPTTLSGIKLLAKSLNRAEGLQHTRALDQASRQAGFQNWPHARKNLKDGQAEPPVTVMTPTWVTVHWRDPETGERGRETCRIDLSKPLTELITPTQLAASRYLGSMKIMAADHLVEQRFATYQSNAQWEVRRAIRTLQFMDVTGLKPSNSHTRIYPEGRYANALPGTDHGTAWFDPVDRQYVYVDEPYEGRAEGEADRRQAWSERFGWKIVKPTWRGMYNADGRSEIYLTTDTHQGYDLNPLVAALDRLPLIPSDWDGESAPYHASFSTPAERAAAAAPPKPRRPAATGATVGYTETFIGPQRRPKARMPLDAHARAGTLLKSVLTEAGGSRRVARAADHIRYKLDEWVMREYPAEADMPTPVFQDLYYHDDGERRTARGAEREVCAGRLEAVKRILQAHYPDCAPLRELLAKADSAIGALRKA
jgi:hypothetical protein